MSTQTSTHVNGVNVDFMSHGTQLQHLAVEDLAQKCAQETDLFFTHHDYDSSYGFELFRRAVQNKWGARHKYVMDKRPYAFRLKFSAKHR